MKNNMRNESPVAGRPLEGSDAPGRADSELTEEKDPKKPKGNVTVNVDDAQLDGTSSNRK